MYHLFSLGGKTMVQQFRENFQKCLSIYRQEIASNAFLLSLIGPFYGLCDYNVYEDWKLSSDMRYFEASNLIYALKNTEGLPADLVKLADDFQEQGYEINSSPDFAEETVKEQIKFIYTILRGEAIIPPVSSEDTETQA